VGLVGRKVITETKGLGRGQGEEADLASGKSG
jgi:hypothetical protein